MKRAPSTFSHCRNLTASWIKLAARQLLPLVKELRPVPAEMVYCYATLLYSSTPNAIAAVGLEARASMQTTLRAITHELNTYYANELPRLNIVERVGALIRIVITAEVSAGEA